MVFGEYACSVLVVSSADRFNSSIATMLPESDYEPVSVEKSVGAARRALLEKAYDIVLINTPLPDEFGTRLAIDISGGSTGLLMFVRGEQYDDVSTKVNDLGVLTLPKPTSPQMVRQTLCLLRATRERIRRLEKKAESVEEKMEEIRLVNRAKWALIERLKMTESEAHRYIEKQAMDQRISRRAAAENILHTHE